MGNIQDSESYILHADCPECGNQWFPFGNTDMVVPNTKNLVCPQCKHKFKKTWLDKVTEKKLMEKELGLTQDGDARKKIDALENKIMMLEKELELEKKKRELVEIQIEQVSLWAETREQDFLEIERIAEELHEEEKYREDNK